MKKLLIILALLMMMLMGGREVRAATECDGFKDCDTKGAFNDSADGIAIDGTCAQKGNVGGNDRYKDRAGNSCANGNGVLQRLGQCDNGTITTAGGAAGGAGGGPRQLADSRTTYKCVDMRCNKNYVMAQCGSGYDTYTESGATDQLVQCGLVKSGSNSYSSDKNVKCYRNGVETTMQCLKCSAPAPVPATPAPTDGSATCLRAFPSTSKRCNNASTLSNRGETCYNVVENTGGGIRANTTDVSGMSCANSQGTLAKAGSCEYSAGIGVVDVYKCTGGEGAAFTYTYKSCNKISDGQQARINYMVSGTTAIGSEIFSCKNGTVDVSTSKDNSLKTMVEANRTKINQCCAPGTGGGGEETSVYTYGSCERENPVAERGFHLSLNGRDLGRTACSSRCENGRIMESQVTGNHSGNWEEIIGNACSECCVDGGGGGGTTAPTCTSLGGVCETAEADGNRNWFARGLCSGGVETTCHFADEETCKTKTGRTCEQDGAGGEVPPPAPTEVDLTKLIKEFNACGFTKENFAQKTSEYRYWAYNLYSNVLKYDKSLDTVDKITRFFKQKQSDDKCGLCMAEYTDNGNEGEIHQCFVEGVDSDPFYKANCMRAFCPNPADGGGNGGTDVPNYEGDCDPNGEVGSDEAMRSSEEIEVTSPQKSGGTYGNCGQPAGLDTNNAAVMQKFNAARCVPNADANTDYCPDGYNYGFPSNHFDGVTLADESTTMCGTTSACRFCWKPKTGSAESEQPNQAASTMDSAQCKAFYVCVGSDGTNKSLPTVHKAGYASLADCEKGELLKGAAGYKGGSVGLFDKCYETQAEADAACGSFLYYCNPTANVDASKAYKKDGQITNVEATQNPYTQDQAGLDACSYNLPRWRGWFDAEKAKTDFYKADRYAWCYQDPEQVLTWCDGKTCASGDGCVDSKMCETPDPDCSDMTLQCKGDGLVKEGKTITCTQAKADKNLTADEQKVVAKCCDGSGEGGEGDDDGDDTDNTCDMPDDDDDDVDDDKDGDDTDNDDDDGGSDDNAELVFNLRKTDRSDEACLENLTWKVHVYLEEAHIARKEVLDTEDKDGDFNTTEVLRAKIEKKIDCSRNSAALSLPEVSYAGVAANEQADAVTVAIPKAQKIFAGYGQKGLANVGPLEGRITTGDANNAFVARQNATGETICVADWTRLTDPTGIKGMETKYGFGGSNGHWIMAEGNATDAGWLLNKETCRFECIDNATPEKQEKGCYVEFNGNVVLTPEFKFVPDLRLVVYGDGEFSATAQPEDQCVPRQEAMSGAKAEIPNIVSTETAAGTVFGFKINDGDHSPIELDKKQAIEHKLVMGENLIGETSFNRYTMSYTLENAGNADATSYFSCMCPSTASGGADCAYENVTPSNNAQVCTTKRIYVGERDCFASAWWQVAGGNVYAQSGMLDRVPTNALTDACKYSQIQCLNAGEENPFLATMKYKNGANYQDILASRNAAENCTARMIRGLDACSSNSNSAGIAMVNGTNASGAASDERILNKIEAVNDRDGNIDLAAQAGLAQRLTDRTSSQGIAPQTQMSADVGATGSKVAADNTGTMAGLNPTVEDFDFLLNSRLAAYVGYDDKPLTVDNLKKLSGELSFGTDYHAWLESNCAAVKYQVAEGNMEDWVCYVDGDLTLAADKNPLYIRAVEKDGVKKQQKVTIFVNGNVNLSSQEAATGQMEYGSNNAVTTVDQGNFLGIVAKGNINVDANVGIEMPNPSTDGATNVDMGLVGKCWESQTATVNETAYGQAINATLATTPQGAGSTEGVFIADGMITIDAYQDLTACGENTVWTDKQYIHQGMMIAWQQLNLYRDFNNRERGCQNDIYGVYNNRVPTETFIYRPDLAVNAPNWMRAAIVLTGGGQ